MSNRFHGRGHWLAQKITAVINLILGIWVLHQFMTEQLWVHTQLGIWLGQGVHLTLLIVMLVSMTFHLLLGSQVIVEDYIHNKVFKAFKLWGQRIVFTGLTLWAIISLL